jgi:hypothetical protein
MEMLAATVRALASSAALPGPLDYEVAIPPVQWAWCRRVAGCNLWLFYRAKEDVVHVLFVTRSPPVPVERGS